MGYVWDLEDYSPIKTNLILDGRKVIVEQLNVYDCNLKTKYIKKTVYYFESKSKAKEYYYKMK